MQEALLNYLFFAFLPGLGDHEQSTHDQRADNKETTGQQHEVHSCTPVLLYSCG